MQCHNAYEALPHQQPFPPPVPPSPYFLCGCPCSSASSSRPRNRRVPTTMPLMEQSQRPQNACFDPLALPRPSLSPSPCRCPCRPCLAESWSRQLLVIYADLHSIHGLPSPIQMGCPFFPHAPPQNTQVPLFPSQQQQAPEPQRAAPWAAAAPAAAAAPGRPKSLREIQEEEQVSDCFSYFAGGLFFPGGGGVSLLGAGGWE
jgi:hypothetical protein